MINDNEENNKVVVPNLTNALELVAGGTECENGMEIPVTITEPEPTEVEPHIEPAVTASDTPIIPEPERTICCDCGCDMDNLTTGEYFGTIMESVQTIWKYHLQATKHSVHIILNEYYEEAQDLVDSIIENFQGRWGIVRDYTNCICGCEKTPSQYLCELRNFVEKGREQFETIKDCSEIMSDIDSLLSLINSTLYKLNNLTESKSFMSFDEFINR